jgi:hypothetical protein
MLNQTWAKAAGAALVVLTTATAPPEFAAAYHVQEHITSKGEQKCRAFRRVSSDTRELQSAHGGALPAGAQRRLEAELHHVRTMAPASLTARRCGVAL